VDHRRSQAFIVLGLTLIVACAAFVPTLTKDTRSEAFLLVDEPALVYREKVKAIFGLTDPMVVAVINDGPQGIFNPHTLSSASTTRRSPAALRTTRARS
jgi:hypothetical protein